MASRLFSRSSLLVLGIGAGLGLVWAGLSPQHYEAQTTLFFPGVKTDLYLKLCQALQSDPSTPSVALPDSPAVQEQENLARLIFSSHAAARAASLPSPAQVETRPGGLCIRVQGRSAEKSRAHLESILTYYDETLKQLPPAGLGKARQTIEGQLNQVAQQLRQVETRLANSSDARLRQLGDSAIQADPKVMELVWLRRSQDESAGRVLLDALEELRQEKPGSGSPALDWARNWAPDLKKKPGGRPKLRDKVRKADLLERLQLERSYSDTLLKFRSLLLQHSFLRTLEDLETTGYEIIDPATVQPLPKTGTYLLCLLAGTGLAFALRLVYFVLGRSDY